MKIFRNSQAATLESPKPQPRITQHNNGPNWPLIILAATVAIIMLAVFGWVALVFLADAAGARNPEREAARAVIYFIVGSIGLYIIGSLIVYIIRNAANPVIDRLYQYKIELAEIEGSRAHAQLMLSTQPDPAYFRLTDEQKRLKDNLAYAMKRAYDTVQAEGEVTEARPWSRAQLGDNYPGPSPMPYDKRKDVRAWLVKHQVIAGDPGRDQINENLFPTFAHFHGYLIDEFTKGIGILQGRTALPSPTPVRDNEGYIHVDS